MFSGPCTWTNFFARSSPALVTTTLKSPFFTRAMTESSVSAAAGLKYQAEMAPTARTIAARVIQRFRGRWIIGLLVCRMERRRA